MRLKRWGVLLVALLGFHGVASASNWSVVGTPAMPRWGHTSVLLSDGRVMSLGGRLPMSMGWMVGTEKVEIFNPATNQWSFAPSLLGKRSFPAHVSLGNGEFLVVGSPDTPISAEVYRPDGSGTATINPPSQRDNMTLTLLSNAKVLMAGGYDYVCACYGNTTVTWLYNPPTNTWSHGNPLTRARTNHTATRLTNNDVLIAGGHRASTSTIPYEQQEGFAERYSSGYFSDTGSMRSPRSYHTATLLEGTDKVVIIGGYAVVTQALAPFPELYDGHGGWTDLAPSVVPRLAGHTATLLNDGRILVVGGAVSWANQKSNSVEIYNPATNSWVTAPSMAYARYGHTATLLPDGRVLVDGGGWDGVLPAEIFTP